MATRKKADKPAINEARVEEIRASARSAVNWAEEVNYKAACTCGLRAARGECYRHEHRRARTDGR